jgi:hypothetical protein
MKADLGCVAGHGRTGAGDQDQGVGRGLEEAARRERRVLQPQHAGRGEKPLAQGPAVQGPGELGRYQERQDAFGAQEVQR